MTFTLERLKAAQVFRIAPDDTNHFVVLFDPSNAPTGNIYVIEVFERGGATPPNSHAGAHEFFYVLHGEGEAMSDGETVSVRQGDALLLEPGSVHVLRNTGAGRLYTLTVMTPNEGFSELIRSGTRMTLDAEDLAVLGGRPA